MPTTLFFLAGEASGDLHGAKLVSALRGLDPSVRCVGMGGPRMASAGLEIAKDLAGMQVMGFWEVAKQYGFFKKVFYELLDRVKQERPAALICIDYPGFNLRFAREVRKLGIPCLYYIVPQVWAWKPRRAAAMAEYIDRAYCVFQFEPPFFDQFRSSRRKMKTIFVGHPLLDGQLLTANGPLSLPPGPKTVALLTGSRENEYRQLALPLAQGFQKAHREHGPLRGMMSLPAGTADEYRAAVTACMGSGPDRSASQSLAQESGKCVIAGPAAAQEELAGLCSALSAGECSHAASLPGVCEFSVVKSGTSTLEAGLQGKPMCVVYRGGWASYAMARLLVDIPVFSLVNIVLGRYAVPELLQGEVNPVRIASEIQRGLEDIGYIESQREALAELPSRLGGPGASHRAAQGILSFLAGHE